jgi:hypothetical protein
MDEEREARDIPLLTIVIVPSSFSCGLSSSTIGADKPPPAVLALCPAPRIGDVSESEGTTHTLRNEERHCFDQTLP